MNQEELSSQLEALITTPGVDADAALLSLGYVPQASEINVEAIIAEATEKGRQEATARVMGILDLCKLAGMPEMAVSLIKDNATVEEARKKIIDAKADESGKDEIISTIGALTTGEVNPILADAQKRAGVSKR